MDDHGLRILPLLTAIGGIDGFHGLSITVIYTDHLQGNDIQGKSFWDRHFLRACKPTFSACC